jgi:hypothetical protein
VVAVVRVQLEFLLSAHLVTLLGVLVVLLFVQP